MLLGLRIWYAKPLVEEGTSVSDSGFGAFFSTFFLTLSNPITFLTFAIFFSCIPEGGHVCSWDHMSLILVGIFTGAMLWWVALALSGTFLAVWVLFLVAAMVSSGTQAGR